MDWILKAGIWIPSMTLPQKHVYNKRFDHNKTLISIQLPFNLNLWSRLRVFCWYFAK
jgi:hypothetical protein